MSVKAWLRDQKVLHEAIREGEIAERCRLVNRDFPWLWAIQSQWEFAREKIRVENLTPKSLENLLMTIHGASPLEIWVHAAGNGDEEAVRKLEISQLDQLQDWDVILGWKVMHLATLKTGSCNEKLVIYRLPKDKKKARSLLVNLWKRVEYS